MMPSRSSRAKIGPNKVGLGAETVEEFERTMASQVFLDRSLSAAVSRRDTACRELERLALRRSKTAAETPQLEARGVKDVPLAPADAPIGSQVLRFGVWRGHLSDAPQSDVSETAPGDFGECTLAETRTSGRDNGSESVATSGIDPLATRGIDPGGRQRRSQWRRRRLAEGGRSPTVVSLRRRAEFPDREEAR